MEKLSNKKESSRAGKAIKKAAIVLTIAIAAFATGYFVQGILSPGTSPSVDGGTGETEQKPLFWTCSMHPSIRADKPGQCPICSMTLIPVYGDKGNTGDKLGPRQLRMSPEARKLASVEVAPVERKYVSAEVRMVGMVDFDETRLRYITAWVPGRIDRLYVDYTGVPVRKGDHMIYLYSPELLSAQQELIQSIRAVKDLKKSGITTIRSTADQTVEAVRQKLRLWGLTQEQIDEIERRGTPSDHMTIYSPISGIVIHKNGVEGMYVNTGARIYTVADLSRLWVKLDAYESDLQWIRYGQQVEFSTNAYPGQVFKGRISFIDPLLDARTRTVKVRVDVGNADGRLKPEMFVRATVHAQVAAGGRVMDPSFAGKWICPMHPEVVKDSAGTCDICEMPLVKAESLGYVPVDEKDTAAPLVIPASAPLITGKRAVVYVAVPDKEGVYEGRDIVLGPRAGDYYIVKEGLAKDDMVVVNGNFKIDSAVQIMAKPSMMAPEGDRVMQGSGMKNMSEEKTGVKPEKTVTKRNVPEKFLSQLNRVLTAYYDIHTALSRDDVKKANTGAAQLVSALDKVDMKLLDGQTHMLWMKDATDIRQSAESVRTTPDIETARKAFALISETMVSAVRRFGTGGTQPVMVFHCPMAFNGRGANWLQDTQTVENPYLGSAMPTCGTVTETIAGNRLEGK
ncbi:MAG: efflux RND transporter periplasmic adaptor subunit [Candidatus Hydrogenedentes bacterium]|nr:efflux RND transporter periplasmic adaptor subunit [Candidatus Hydrogenedentota bacterium]